MITYLLIKSKGKQYVIFLYCSIFYFLICSIFFGFIKSIVSYLVIFFGFKIYSMFKIKSNNIFDIYFGVPGCGKSTSATNFALDYLKKDIKVFANFECLGTTFINKQDIKYSNEDLRNCLLIIDEAGLDFNNRNYKTNFSEDAMKLFKKHRHLNIDIMIFSQSWEDMDITLRRLGTRLFVLKRSIIPFFIKRKLISKKISVNKDNKQIIDEYMFIPFSGYYIFMPRTWKSFNTLD